MLNQKYMSFAYALAKQNIGIVFISSELTEVINVSDRVAVMKEGRLRAILDRDECLEDKVLSYAIVDDNNIRAGDTQEER